MDLYQLKMFFNLGKVKNYTETAKSLNVTQSAVSHAIKKLETSLETRLIHKKGNNFNLHQLEVTYSNPVNYFFMSSIKFKMP